MDVTAAILIRNGKLLIARRSPGQKLAGKWEFAGGKLEEGETPEACLRRELREELDVDVTVGRFFGESRHEYDHLKIRLLAYVAWFNTGEVRLKDHDRFRLVSIEELAGYDFAPADIPFLRRLENEGLPELSEDTG